ncbi:MAG: preprotein translocase subunit SecA [candidate division Zixibacteria bacterium]|nr:preprotein translocase subunit SecA [candidate division Zixibacteria bacterium]
MVSDIIARIFGSKHEKDVKKIQPMVEQINGFCEQYKSLSDEELKGKTEEFKQRIKERTGELEQQLDALKEEFAGIKTHGLSEEERAEVRSQREALLQQMKDVQSEIKKVERETLDEILPDAFAVVKETCRRLLGKKWEVCGIQIEWDMVPYDVQLIGAVVLHQGKITEMATGEGKTLAATMPLYLNALTGKGCHLVTVNDYLARRDTEWMGEIYKFLGLTVGCIQNEMDNEQRKVQYNCDIIYGTNNEFGFDYLRDNMAIRAEDRVQRGYNYAIVDEVDSVLIDEARTPLIISGPVSSNVTQSYMEMRPLVEQLFRKQATLVNKMVAEGEELLKGEKEYEAGIKLLIAQRGAPKNKRLMKLGKEPGVKKLISRTELDFMRDKKLHELDEFTYFSIDERENTINLNEMGRSLLSPEDQALFILPDITEGIHQIDSDDSLSSEEKLKRKEKLYQLHAERSEKNHSISQLLKAFSLFEKDVEYVVQDGKVMIVDEFTGRLMPGRRYSDGLHQAIEAKEGVKVEGETQTFATITLQNFFRLYHKLAGMTGTAVTEASELWEIYKVDVVAIPTNEPVRRIDYDDMIYRTRREKYNAIIYEIVLCHEVGRPALVGTVSVEASETLSRMLKRKGIKHSVLNAKYHQQEAEIVSRAGQAGTVTIATNMAGRGTDIKLGEGVVKHPHCRLVTPDREDGCPYLGELGCNEDVPCGLRIIGTERHEARRIDRQLRGRSGRQGDPGSSKFFLSLEDDLMRLFGSDRIASIMDRLGVQEGDVIRHSMVTKAIERAQRRVEAQNFSIRKHLLEYDDVMNQQREVIYDRRLVVLEGADLREEILDLIKTVIESKVEAHTDASTYPEAWNLGGLKQDLLRAFLVDVKFDPKDLNELKQEDLKENLYKMALQIYDHKEKMLGEELMRQLERYAMLRTIDEKWKEHLYDLDQVKTGIGLRAYGQRDPLIEYKKEAFALFTEMLERIDEETLELIFKLRVEERERPRRREPERQMQAVHQSTVGMGYAETQPAEQVAPGKPKPVRVGKKIGRNDPCPCGSGKKYKKCCGA